MRALEPRSWLTIRSPSIVSPPLSRLCTGFRSPLIARARRTPYLGRTRESATCGVRRASTLAPPQAGRPLWHPRVGGLTDTRSEEHTSELQSLAYLVCRLLLEKKNNRGRRTCDHD